MRMMLLYENGLRVETVVLATSDYRMRVIFRGAKDTTELRLLQDQWMTEEGDAVDIESVLLAGAPHGVRCVRGNAA
ncbi:MAG TPA: hypothetical protein VKT49_19180 [Bryobacteraceae bacterium]|nr:hypothetical protein [Bryobacteraceae bacterium]